MTAQWYTYNSHPNKEEALWRQLQTNEINCYYPQLKVRPVNPRSRKIRPYFPGYLFIHADLEVVGISTLQYMPYSKGLVSFGGEIAVVPETLITSIKQRVDQINQQEAFRSDGKFQHGDKVVIEGGVLNGYEAIFDEKLSGTDRSRILIKFLNDYAKRIEISNQFLKKPV
jgi:transcription antitermination factor NusG